MLYGDDLGRSMAMSGSESFWKGERRSASGGRKRLGDELETVGDVIRDLLQKQAKLSGLIDDLFDEEEKGASERIIKLLALHGQNASRIGRLLRDQKAVEGEDTDKLLETLGPVLDQLSAELGLDL